MTPYMITKNLSSNEVKCPCCDAVVFDREFVDKLQILRDLMQKSFLYSKGGFYRCRMYNDSLNNSSKRSQHLMGKACDITTHEWTATDRWKLVKHAVGLGFSVGVYSAHIHLDLRLGLPVCFYGTY